MAGNVRMFPTNFDLHMDGIVPRRDWIDDNMAEHPNSDTEIKLSCRTVSIGSYSYKPHSKVRISSEGVTIVAPGLRRRAGDDIILHIPLKSFVHVVARAEERPAILLYTESKTGEYVRNALDMHLESGTYFEPTSALDEHKCIKLVPRALPRRSVASLRSLFGMVLDELDALDARRLGGGSSSERDSAHSDAEQPSPGKAAGRADPPSRPETPINIKDNASSSSSIIFPPSPTPISLSSHSSTPTTPKSSHSSKKRKIRKKNKSNKKMKYVLVKNPEPHAVDAFLAGVAPILKSLSPVFLNLAKSEIISAALKYERKMLTENCNGVDEK